MTRIIKGFAVDWGDRWRRTVWAQLEHIYWFNVLPDRQVDQTRTDSAFRGVLELARPLHGSR